MLKTVRSAAATWRRGAVTRKVKLLAPWWHDIDLPRLGTSTHRLSGVDVRLLHSYEPKRFPRDVLAKIPLGERPFPRVLEIGPASGFYTLWFAQRGSNVVCLERTERFLRQISFLRKYFRLQKRISIIRGSFPEVLPKGVFDMVWCLGVLYHVFDYVSFLSALNSLAATTIYLETHVSKTGETEIAGVNEGYAFAPHEIGERILQHLPDYDLVRQIDFTDSENPHYNRLSYYRCVLELSHQGSIRGEQV